MEISLRVAVLGAGIQGTLIALELAGRGIAVDIYDRGDLPVTGASVVNEGKIHVGYVYGADTTSRSARLMIEGASRFGPLLARWMESDVLRACRAEPDVYAVMRDTLVEPDVLHRRYLAMTDMANEVLSAPGRDYLFEKAPLAVRRLATAEIARHYNPDEVVAAFVTGERSIDATVIARELRRALLSAPSVSCHWRQEIEGVRRRDDGRIEVLGEGLSTPLGAYAHVVNATWGDLHHIDRTAGVFSGRAVLQRRKFGINFRSQAGKLPPTTFVLGPYGAVVSFPDGRHYLSWYPICCTESSDELRMPRHWRDEPDAATLARVRDDTVARMRLIVPGIDAIVATASDTIVAGGPIVAWGRNDIDTLDSELHKRFDVGINTHWGNYHSVDTAKYTLAPMFAEEVARRVAGED